MLDIKEDWGKILSSCRKSLELDPDNAEIANTLNNSKITLEEVDYDNWNGGTYIYRVNIEMEPEQYARVRKKKDRYCNEILSILKEYTVGSTNDIISEVVIKPICKQYLNWSSLAGIADKQAVLESIERIEGKLISVATHAQRIDDVNDNYKKEYEQLSGWLSKIGLIDPNPFGDLWQWYGYWKQNLDDYASRKQYIIELYKKTVDTIKDSASSIENEYTPTGWMRVDRTLINMQKALFEAATEEQYQAIGMFGREALITAAQEVYDPNIHKSSDNIEPSKSDAKRMLEGFINYELKGNANERPRKCANSTLELANHLTHDRMASRKDAELCFISVSSTIQIIKTLFKYRAFVTATPTG